MTEVLIRLFVKNKDEVKKYEVDLDITKGN